MKYFIITFLAAVFSLAAFPTRISLPQNVQVQKDELSRLYLTPMRIMWVSPKDNVENIECLLKKGDGQSVFFNPNICKIKNRGVTSFILDFGKEIHGGIQFVTGLCSPSIINVRIRFGESVSECNSDVNGGKENSSANDFAIRDRIFTLPHHGTTELGNMGFRFVRIDVLDSNATVQLKEIRAIMRYRDIPYLGSFHCSDARLDSIWDVGAYTTHLNMQEYLWDGIKRDRTIWVGDMHPEVATITSVFGANPIVEKTLSKIIEQYPLPHWLNNYSSYSMWYLVILYDWYMYSGNKAYLLKNKNYLKGLITQMSNHIHDDGSEDLAPKRFLDWPSSTNKEGVESGYRALLSLSLDRAEKLALFIGDSEIAEIALKAQKRLNKIIKSPNGLEQAATVMALSGTMSAKEACSEYIDANGIQNFTSFFGYYFLTVLAMNGEYQQAMDYISKFWGGMLDLGATTFWEDFNINWMQNAARIDEFVPKGKIDVHASYGKYCYSGYRCSYCHGWASGPTPWLTKYVLGVNIAEPGCKKLIISPHLGNLTFVQGSFPTPLGLVKIKHIKSNNGKIMTTVLAPKGISIIKTK